ncbi:hypothetical protein ACKKBG_A07395 [Auxenochlorella protothecoides x Auxenochlorella symbiontica]
MQVKAIMLTSGTLSPLASFAAELSIVFPHRLENPHVIDPSQVWVGCVPVGPSGHPLNSSFQTRGDLRYREDLGNSIVNFARIVPDGLLVFFPSYGLLDSCVEGWKLPSSGGSTIWERICRHKAPVVEPRDSAQFVLAVQDFQAKLDGPGTGGAVLFAVCRGKASEGIDFSDRAGRAVIITGIPYANKADAKVRLKQEVLNESLRGRVGAAKRPIGMPGEAFRGPGRPEALSGDQWYVQQAVRAVNQAMGRVIRHKDDYGAVILCDERFKTPNMRNQLSKWLREQTVVFPDYGKAAGSLTTFFRANAGRAREPAAQTQREPAAAQPFASAVTGGAPRPGEVAVQQAKPGPLLASLPTAMDLAGITASLLGGASGGGAVPARRPGDASGPGLLQALDRGTGAPTEQPAAARRTAERSVRDELPGSGHAVEGLPDGDPSRPGTSQALPPMRQRTDDGPAAKPWQRASTARPTAARVESGAPDEAEPSQAGDTGAVVGTTGLSDGRSGADGSISQQPHSAAQPSGPGPPPDPTRPAPHGTSATLPSRELTVKEYMAQLRAGLAPELFRRINAALQAYQASRDREALVASVIATLDRPEQFALLAGFSLFLPKAERAGFRNRIGPAPSADSAWAVPGDGERLPLHDGPSPLGSSVAPARQTVGKTVLGRPAQPSSRRGGGGAQGASLPPQVERLQPGPGRATPVTQQPAPLMPGPDGRATVGAPTTGPRSSARPRVALANATNAARPGLGSGTAAGCKVPAWSGGAEPAPGRAAPARRPVGAGAPAPTPPCSICGKVPMSSAYEASCGHLACYACWLGALAKFKCPTCGKGVRKSHLLPKHFV